MPSPGSKLLISWETHNLRAFILYRRATWNSRSKYFAKFSDAGYDHVGFDFYENKGKKEIVRVFSLIVIHLRLYILLRCCWFSFLRIIIDLKSKNKKFTRESRGYVIN